MRWRRARRHCWHAPSGGCCCAGVARAAPKSCKRKLFIERLFVSVSGCRSHVWAGRALKKRPGVLTGSKTDRSGGVGVQFLRLGRVFLASGAPGGSGLRPEPPRGSLKFCREFALDMFAQSKADQSSATKILLSIGARLGSLFGPPEQGQGRRS